MDRARIDQSKGPLGCSLVPDVDAIKPCLKEEASMLVQSRPVQLDPFLEEAAMDLGARPLRTFFQITVPLLAPALVPGWLMAGRRHVRGRP